jgi:hypothetical protein
MRLHAVNDPEVDGLGHPPHVGSHLISRDVVDQRRRDGVNVVAPGKGVDQEGIAAHVRQQAKLDLRVVSRHQHRIIKELEFRAMVSDEGPAHPSPQFGADGDVLQVGVR